MTQQTKRNRPRISASISGYTKAVIMQAAKDLALPNPGVTLDYIVNDWVNLKLAAIDAAHPASADSPSTVAGHQAA